jgi:hypothetical protein
MAKRTAAKKKATKTTAVRKPTQPAKSRKPTARRTRAATQHKPNLKRRNKSMTTAEENATPQQQHKEPRGIGGGEKANATRSRNYNESPDEHLAFAEGKSAADYKPEAYEPGTEYPEGDPAKGKLDFGTVAVDPNLYIAQRDRRAYLVDQAEKNEAANDELNAIQVEQNKRVQMASNLVNDPDFQRDNSMQTAVAALEMHNPDAKDEGLKGAMEARAERDRAQVAQQQGENKAAQQKK